MFRSQPDLEVRKRAVPIEYLNEKGGEESGDMKDPDPPIVYSPKGTQKKEQYPDKMDQDNNICKHFVEH